MPTRGIRYADDAGNIFTTSAGRWVGAAPAAGMPLANLYNPQIRKVVLGFVKVDQGMTMVVGTNEIAVMDKASFDTINVGQALPAALTIQGEPLDDTPADATAIITAKIMEDLKNFVQKGR